MFSLAKLNIKNISSFAFGLSDFLDNVFHLVFPFLSWASLSISSMLLTKSFNTWGAWQVFSMQGNLALAGIYSHASWHQHWYSDTITLCTHFWCHGCCHGTWCCWPYGSYAITQTPVHGGSLGSIITIRHLGFLSFSSKRLMPDTKCQAHCGLLCTYQWIKKWRLSWQAKFSSQAGHCHVPCLAHG